MGFKLSPNSELGVCTDILPLHKPGSPSTIDSDLITSGKSIVFAVIDEFAEFSVEAYSVGGEFRICKSSDAALSSSGVRTGDNGGNPGP